jgi:hypothetical protein
MSPADKESLLSNIIIVCLDFKLMMLVFFEDSYATTAWFLLLLIMMFCVHLPLTVYVGNLS